MRRISCSAAPTLTGDNTNSACGIARDADPVCGGGTVFGRRVVWNAQACDGNGAHPKSAATGTATCDRCECSTGFRSPDGSSKDRVSDTGEFFVGCNWKVSGVAE